MNKIAKIKFNKKYKKYLITHFIFVLLISFTSILLYNFFTPRLESFGANNKIATSADDYVTTEAFLYFKPADGQYTVGNTFSTALMIDAVNAINSEDIDIIFPPDNLEVISISKEGTINSLWTEDPNFNNSKGTISFAGGIFNPGFIGKEGRLVTIKFRVKKDGNAQIKLSQVQILANDGNGTNLLTSTKSALFGLYKQMAVPVSLVAKRADFNGDGKISSTDLSIMLSARGTNKKAQDLNGDGKVNMVDISIFLSYYKK